MSQREVVRDYVEKFQAELQSLTEYLNQKVSADPKKYHYTTFGKVVESDAIQFLLERNCIMEGKFKDQSDNKNAVPDLIDLQLDKPVFIDFKSGNMVKYKTGNPVKNANQDISTLYSWKDKILTEYDPEHCFLLEIKYRQSQYDDAPRVVECEFDHFYKFIGKNTDGLISYREKDGCVRPKNWDAPPQFSSGQEFVDLLRKTFSRRAKNIITKKYPEMDQDDKDALREDLQKDYLNSSR